MDAKSQTYCGEVAYIYAIDLAYEMDDRPISYLLGQPVVHFAFDADRRIPRDLLFYRPQMIRLPPIKRITPQGPVEIRQTIKLFSVGAITVTIHIPFADKTLEDLVNYHNMRFDGKSLDEEVWRMATQVQTELAQRLARKVSPIPEEEPYTVFCLDSAQKNQIQPIAPAEKWLVENNRTVAALLMQEDDPSRLSQCEVNDTVSHYLSYYQNDVVVMDWDAALLMDDAREFPELLHVMELACVQLAELSACDKYLDEVMQKSYRQIMLPPKKRQQSTFLELRELRLDMTRINDELSNTTKFFGDWHFAKIYRRLFELFHLDDWQRTLDEKLKTLDDLYQLFKHDQFNRLMVILEVMVVVCFVIDLIIIGYELLLMVH